MSRGVAVVVPCYNAARWLPETLRSVQAQTHEPVEILVVDDGSTDESARVAEELGVRCERQPNRGPAAARNRGVATTTAPFVAFLDADDVFSADKLAAQVAHLERTGAVMSCTDAWVLRDGVRSGRKNGGRTVPTTLTRADLIAANPVICSSVLVRRDALAAAGPFDEDPELIATEDYDLWLRIAAIGEIAYLDRPLLDYRVTPGQLSDDERFLRGVERIMAKVVATAPEDRELLAATRARRAAVRLDLAYRLARERRRRECRVRLREAGELGAPAALRWRIWLRSLL